MGAWRRGELDVFDPPQNDFSLVIVHDLMHNQEPFTIFRDRDPSARIKWIVSWLSSVVVEVARGDEMRERSR